VQAFSRETAKRPNDSRNRRVKVINATLSHAPDQFRFATLLGFATATGKRRILWFEGKMRWQEDD